MGGMIAAEAPERGGVPGEFRRREMDMPGCFRTRDSLFVLPEEWKTVNAVVKNVAFPR